MADIMGGITVSIWVIAAAITLGIAVFADTTSVVTMATSEAATGVIIGVGGIATSEVATGVITEVGAIIATGADITIAAGGAAAGGPMASVHVGAGRRTMIASFGSATKQIRACSERKYRRSRSVRDRFLLHQVPK